MTTRSATQRVHEVAGYPAMAGCVETIGECWICSALMTRGAPIDKWQGSSFTDQNKARHSSATHVCEACVWACSWVQPPDRPKVDDGKKGLNLRLFSHLCDGRGYRSANKKDKRAILEWLRSPKVGPWFAAIADTGQKHVLPWTPINVCETGGLIRFEERTLRLPAADGWAVCDSLVDLLSLGVTKTEVESGEYSVRTYQEHAAAVVEFEEQYGSRLRGGTWFELALWLSQRDEERYADRQAATRSAAGKDGKRGAGAPARVSGGRSKPAETLEPVARPAPEQCANNSERGGVVHEDVPEPAGRGAKQLSLFGAG